MSFHCLALIPDLLGNRVLLIENEDGGSLPCLELEEHSVEKLDRAVQEKLGLSAYARRYLRRGEEIDTDPQPWVYAFENRSDCDLLSDGIRWATRGELAEIVLNPPTIRPLIEEFFAELTGDTPPSVHRPAWSLPGWLEEVEGWIDARLEANGLSRNRPFVQIKKWSISCLLRIPVTTGEVIYFKAVPPLFGNEPRITQGLARLYPEQFPTLLDLDADRHWMLMREMKGIDLYGTDIETEQKAFRRFARIQKDCASRTEELLALGCADRRLNTMPALIDALWNDLRDPDKRVAYDLSDAESLTPLSPVLKEMCDRLAEYGLPETLIHGDLHGGNVRVNGDQILFYDWTDAAVSHPFFDLLGFRIDTDKLENPAGLERDRIVADAYLSVWSDSMSADRLREAYELSQKLLLAYHALSYRYIAAHAEPLARHELSGAVGYFLKELLKLHRKGQLCP